MSCFHTVSRYLVLLLLLSAFPALSEIPPNSSKLLLPDFVNQISSLTGQKTWCQKAQIFLRGLLPNYQIGGRDFCINFNINKTNAKTLERILDIFQDEPYSSWTVKELIDQLESSTPFFILEMELLRSVFRDLKETLPRKSMPAPKKIRRVFVRKSSPSRLRAPIAVGN